MRLRTWHLAKPFAVLAILVVTCPVFVQAQTITKVQRAAPVGVSLVYCNEDDSFEEPISLPTEGIDVQGGRIAAWRYQISAAGGDYKFSIRSNARFAVLVRKRVGGKGNWNNVKTATLESKLRTDYINKRRYHYWSSLSFRQGPDNPLRSYSEFAVSARPTRQYQKLVASWYTAGCETSGPDVPPQACAWVGGGLFGATLECQCGGRKAPDSRCGRKP